MFSFPSEEHRCFAGEEVRPIDSEHQVGFCLGGRYETCQWFVPRESVRPMEAGSVQQSPIEVAREALADQPEGMDAPAPPFAPGVDVLRDLSPMRIALWATAAVMLLAVVYYYGSRLLLPPPALPTATIEVPHIAAGPASPTASPTVTGTPTPVRPTPIPITPPPSPTLPVGGRYYRLVPEARAVGWVSADRRAAQFGQRNVYAGSFQGQTYYGILQFDLSSIPVGAQVSYVALSLTGLNDENIGATGTWQVRILDPRVDENWANLTFDTVRDAAVVDTLSPTLSPGDLARKRVNTFVFDARQRSRLEQRLISGKFSLRIDGPATAEDDLFGWDSGYGGGFGNRPTLLVIAVPPPTLTPIVVTSTPAPANVFEAATRVALATLYATTTGTATPWPPNIVTATPRGRGNPLVITNTPTPANPATATFVALMETAIAATTGTPTPIPAYVSTATPHPPYVIITATPTPADVFAAATMAARATYQARFGTPTPLPPYYVTATFTPTPFVVLNTPTPANAATATFIAAYATAVAATTGTATPLPPNAVTATHTPVVIPLDVLSPTPTATLAPAPTAPVHIPAALHGKILFLSSRFGGSEPTVLVMNPDGSDVSLLTNRQVYERALELDRVSTDGTQRLFVREVKGDFQIWVENLADGYTWFLVGQGGRADYDPAWAPDGARVAYVSQRDRNFNDEIHVVNKSARTAGGEFLDIRITQNLVMDKHPSWSPDSKQIVFWSNRLDDPALWRISDRIQNRQIWISDDDGQHQHNISQNGYDDWDPVWVKPYWP
jgi:hypothetical protein